MNSDWVDVDGVTHFTHNRKEEREAIIKWIFKLLDKRWNSRASKPVIQC